MSPLVAAVVGASEVTFAPVAIEKFPPSNSLAVVAPILVAGLKGMSAAHLLEGDAPLVFGVSSIVHRAAAKRAQSADAHATAVVRPTQQVHHIGWVTPRTIIHRRDRAAKDAITDSAKAEGEDGGRVDDPVMAELNVYEVVKAVEEGNMAIGSVVAVA